MSAKPRSDHRRLCPNVTSSASPAANSLFPRIAAASSESFDGEFPGPDPAPCPIGVLLLRT